MRGAEVTPVVIEIVVPRQARDVWVACDGAAEVEELIAGADRAPSVLPRDLAPRALIPGRDLSVNLHLDAVETAVAHGDLGRGVNGHDDVGLLEVRL